MSAPTGALAVLRRRKRVIDGGGTTRPQSTDTPPWITGVLAAVQAAVLSLSLLVLPAVTAYVVTSADPSNVGTSWVGSVKVAAGMWILGHGGPLIASGVSVSLIPLGLTILLIFICYASARRTAQMAWSAFAAGVGSYALVGILVGLVSGLRTPGQLLLTLLGTAAVAAAGLGGGILKHPQAPRARDLFARQLDRVPPALLIAIRGGVLAAAWLVIFSVLLVVTWIFMGRAPSLDVINALSLSWIDGIILALAQALFLANLVVWGLSWIAGPGFSVGTGSVFAPTEVLTGPLPAMPILGALPDDHMVNSVTAFAPALVVVCGILAAIYTRRRTGALTWPWVGIVVATITLTTGLIVAVLTALSSGAIGPGRMTDVGAAVFPVAGAVMAAVATGAVIVLVGFHAGTFKGLRAVLDWRSWRRWLHRATGSTTPAAVEPTAVELAEEQPRVPRPSSPRVASVESARSAASAQTASAQTMSSARSAASTRTVGSSQAASPDKSAQSTQSAD